MILEERVIEIDESKYEIWQYVVQKRDGGRYHVSSLCHGPGFASIPINHWVHSARSFNHWVLENQILRSKLHYVGRHRGVCNCGLDLGQYHTIKIARAIANHTLEVAEHELTGKREPTKINYLKIIKAAQKRALENETRERNMSDKAKKKLKKAKDATEAKNSSKKGKKGKSGKVKSTKVKKSSSEPAAKRNLDGHIMLSDICEEMDVSPTAVRRMLRNSDIEKPGASWAWAKGDADIKRVKQLIKTGE